MSARVAALLLILALLTGCQASVGQPPAGPAEPPQEAVEPPAEPGEPTESEPNPGPGEPSAEGPASEEDTQPGASETPDPDTPVTSVPAQPSTGGVALPEVPEGERSRFVANGDRSCSLVALTYDAGSGADGAEAILDMLKKHDLKVTFFLTGRWAEQYPDLARRIADEGHEIGNHTYSHPDLTTIPDEEVLQQIADGEEAIRQATGKDPRPLFREPYGAFNDHERTLVRQAGYSYSIYWDLDTLDWQFPGVETTVERLLRAQSGSIVLMHLNVPDSAAASDQVIPVLQERGLQIVPVSRLIECGI